ncbi:MAG TPA: FUSC family protein [Stellaceae bacterium]|nr:FUSC family protein [Stellaceae bacterium]
MTLVQGSPRAVTVAGFPLPAWAFALRIWIAMVVALYAAFWLQLESAASAAVTVAILALQTRGQVYQKGIYWLLATISGIVASFVIAGLFPQDRVFFLVGFAGWLGVCIYAGGLLDGNRAFGAILPSYTVAQVAVAQIDSPQSIFAAGVNRGAAIVVGIAALALVTELFVAPNLHRGLSSKLSTAQQRVRAFALAVLRGAGADPIQSAHLLREITALHPDITALVAESTGDRARGAAAASAAVALVAEVGAARSLASLPASTAPALRRPLAEALADAPGSETHALQLQLRLQQHAGSGYGDPHGAIFARHALDLLLENQRAQDAIEDLRAGRHPARDIHAPIYRSHRAAARNGLRAFLAVLISEILLSLAGWPFASEGLALLALIIALSANTPNPRAFPVNAAIAVPIAALLAGVMQFLILDGVDQFPLLAIGMAPVVLVTALLLTVPNPRLVSISFLVLIFFLVIFSPTNPQVYNPEAFLFTSTMAIAAVILVFVLLQAVLPTSAALQRRWYLTSARAEMRDLLAGGRSRSLGDAALFRDADRVGQLAALQPAGDDARREDLHQALDIFACAAAARRVRTTLAELTACTSGGLAGDGYAALAAGDPPGLRRAAAALASTAAQLDHDARAAARAASLTLIWVALLIDTSPFGLDPRRSTGS